MGMWKMANYHLKCNSTEWSIPVGLFPSHWQGKIFAFDEMYAVQGLVSAGHFREARIAPQYRLKTLPDAVRRCRHRTKRHFGYGARWVWEGMEYLNVEGSSRGFWLDHIFHMSAIAQTCWIVYQYTDDIKYLREVAYPVMRECARFYRSQAVVEAPHEGGAFIVPCTDLERLGPGRVRPFMTTCGVIHTFRAVAAAAKLLNVDEEEAADLTATAFRLEKLLPQAEGRFMPSAEDAGAVSMGTLAGHFPFPVFSRDNALQRGATRFFLAQGVKGGNMYPTGKLICPWYAGTMSVAALFSGEGKRPVEYLYEAAKSGGCWGEFWEINEPGVAEYRPWFMTAAGNCLYAINQLFVSNQDGELRLCCGVPKEWKDYSFRLPAHGGLTVDCQVENGRFKRLALIAANPSKDKKVTLRFSDGQSRVVTVDEPRKEICR
jgi:alpha-L-fucosidase 2